MKQFTEFQEIQVHVVFENVKNFEGGWSVCVCVCVWCVCVWVCVGMYVCVGVCKKCKTYPVFSNLQSCYNI